MRYAPAERLLRLALQLAGSRAGMTLDEMAAFLEAGRRTAERSRDALAALFPQLEVLEGEDRARRWRLPATALHGISAPRPDTVAAVEAAGRAAAAAGEADRAERLRDAAASLRALMQPAALRRAEPDIEALMLAEGVAMRPGPRPVVADGVVRDLRRAILGMQLVVIRYEAAGAEPATRILCPYGILYGGRGWLVAHVEGLPELRLWRLDRIVSLDLLDRIFPRREDFDLSEYAAQSFGVFQGDTMDVVVRIAPEAAAEAEGWVFHPSQRFEREADGSLLVRFTAAGAQEMCWHFFTWGASLRIVEPAGLRDMMGEMVGLLADQLATYE